jgi:hypothetical protein
MKSENRVKLMELLNEIENDPTILPHSELEDARLMYRAAYHVDPCNDLYRSLLQRAKVHAEAAFSVFVREDAHRAQEVHELLVAIDSELNPTEVSE